MSRANSEIVHKDLEETLVLSTRLVIREREELWPLFEKIAMESEGEVTDPPFAVFYWDTGVEGIEVEAGYPVSRPMDTATARSGLLKEAEAYSITHLGPYGGLQQSYSRLYTQLYARALPASLISREIYIARDAGNPMRNLTEVQVLVHDWDDRLSQATGDVLGAEARDRVMMGSELLGPDSTREERTCWISEAVRRLDTLADDEQKYDILSRCAHLFPEQRIKRLKDIYVRTGRIEPVLKEMEQDPEWYESPSIEGGVIRVRKVPCNRPAYDAAKNVKEKMNAYCHCPMVRDRFREFPPSFCYCGSGWYRTLWEGILGKPLRVRISKTLVNGDDFCEFCIDTLEVFSPRDRTGERE